MADPRRLDPNGDWIGSCWCTLLSHIITHSLLLTLTCNSKKSMLRHYALFTCCSGKIIK